MTKYSTAQTVEHSFDGFGRLYHAKIYKDAVTMGLFPSFSAFPNSYKVLVTK